MALRALLALVMVAALSGCNNTCTLIGCPDTLAFQLGAAAQQFGVDEPVTVTACIGEVCVTEVVTKPAGSGGFGSNAVTIDADGTLRCAFNTGAALNSKRVSLRLKKNGAVVLDEARPAVPFTWLYPNGVSCGPVCQSATVTLE